ncbi:polysaccharide biosynthesis tyrosine autokinase [Pedobacter sp. SYSU D00535]|uniref:GumC family protein n=1 Tax=Pedobacter sp. SYSU D00535 TaxID=2810308 RepID=UPI001A9638C8|nr:polysaccharide biosynthesis tyrosine autokinase [Pedobacter sp. SYSU D00535]
MNTERILISPISEVKGDNADFNLRETINKYVFHWPLFLLGIVLALTLAYFYLRYSDPEYEIKAKLLIKDDKKDANPVAEELKRLDVFSSSNVVENELEVLQSRKIMKKVVEDLDLWVSYQKVGRVNDLDFYDQTPVRLTMIKPAEVPANESFEVIIKSPEKYLMIRPNGETKEIGYGHVVTNSMGTWKLDTTGTLPQSIGYKIRVSVSDLDKAADKYASKVSTEKLNKQASVVEIVLKDNVLSRGKKIVNSLVVAYNEEKAEEKRKIAENALQFIDSRLDSLSGELTSVEKDFEGFRSSQGITNISSEAQLYLENVKANDIQLNDVNVKLNVIEGIESYLRSNNANSAPATFGISDPALIANINKLMELQLQKDRLLATTPESNPVFEPINKQIATTKAGIRENVGNIKRSLLAAKSQLSSNNDRFEASIKNIPGQERKFVSIKRQQSVKENLYVYLLQKREEAALSYAQTLTASTTVDYTYDESEKKSLTFAVAFLLGLIIPAGVVYGRGLINNSVTNTREIEETSVPVLGELMYMDTDDYVVVRDSERSIVAEQFRAMRTNLLYLHERKESGRVTLITSSIPNEGKSFVSTNLAAALATSGRKTIILEMDFRKPKIAEYLGLDPHKGLTEYLTGKATATEIIQSSNVDPDLFVMATGELPANPTKLLDSKRMDDLIAWLRTEYDDIIIDTPPVYLVTDAMILARLSDVSLYVVRQGTTLKEHLQYIKGLNKQQKFRKLNIVFNGIQMDGKYGYGYSYDYGYYVKPTSQKTNYKATIRSFLNRF